MATYLIDYENTGVKGLYGIERLKDNDLIIVFYGPRTGAVSFEDHVRIASAVSRVEYIKTTKTAKNYLDFQLTTYLGYLAAQGNEKKFFVISKDNGFDSVVDFWKARGFYIRRQENVAGEKMPVKTKAKSTAKQESKEVSENSETKEAEKNNESCKKNQAQDRRNNKKRNDNEQMHLENDNAVLTDVNEILEEVANEDAAEVQTQVVEEKAKKTTRRGRKKKSAEPVSKEVEITTEDTEKQADAVAKEKATKEKNAKDRVTKEKVATEEKTAASEESVADAKAETKLAPAKAVPEKVKKKVREALKEEKLHVSVYKKIYACMLECDSKQTYNTAMVKTFTQEVGNVYYKATVSAFNAWLKERTME